MTGVRTATGSMRPKVGIGAAGASSLGGGTGDAGGSRAVFGLGGGEDDPRSEIRARQALQGQVARLELELDQLRCSAWPRSDLALTGPGGLRTGPRLQSLGELEQVRDGLVAATARARRALAARTQVEEGSRRLVEEMLLDPQRHAGVRIRSADLGQSGCTTLEARPVAGLLGMLLGWWRVVISSGCP
jgi:hypothetical protein